MAGFNINNIATPWKQGRTAFFKNADIDLNDISTIYKTTLQESQRGIFGDTFEEFNVKDYEPSYRKYITDRGDEECKLEDYAYKFYETITSDDTKEMMCRQFNLEEEEYDALACIGLALASQETGMGFEDGYNEENEEGNKNKKERDTKIQIANFLDDVGMLKPISKFLGMFGVDIAQEAQSASSGITQIKIDDMFNNSKFNSNWTNQVLKYLNVESESVTKNNIYENPDLSAYATMGYLITLYADYSSYEGAMEAYHTNISNKLQKENIIGYNKALEEGYNSILSIYDTYINIGKENNLTEQKNFRDIAKNWVLSVNGSTLNIKEGMSEEEILELASKPENALNEEAQLILLNSKLPNDKQLTKDSLNYIRLFLSEESQQMSALEYIPFAWNTGAKPNDDEKLHKYDRFISTQMGIILSDPKTYQYDQFTPNVVELAKKYAQQSTGLDGDYMIEDALENRALYGFQKGLQ